MLQIPGMDDPRLAEYPEEQRRKIIQQMRTQKADPNFMIEEKCAITCRVASSFTRVGHLDLFARRAKKKPDATGLKKLLGNSNDIDPSTPEFKELQDLVWHACYREFRDDAYTPFYEKGDIASAATVLLEKSADAISSMVAGWVRVGFVQGNFNADNCLVGGKTMDYGPFGFVEEYNPLSAKWTGSGQHFGFLNQPSAGYVNYIVLVESVAPVISAANGKSEEDIVNGFKEKAQQFFKSKLNEASE